MFRILETRSHIRFDDTHMNVLRVGVGEPVMLAHSYLWDAEMWRPQINDLAASYNVIVPELWGHGASGVLPGGTLSIRSLAVQHLELLDHLGLRKVTIVGLSVGAMWAAELALIAPERVRGLVLIDSFLGPEPVERREQFARMLDMIEATGTPTPQLVDALVPFFLSQRARQEQTQLAQHFQHALMEMDSAQLVRSIVPLGRMIFGRRDALPDLADLDIPTLVMTGSEDLSRPPAEGQEMAQVIDCPFVEIPGAGHISSLEQPEFVNRQLQDFLSTLHASETSLPALKAL